MQSLASARRLGDATEAAQSGALEPDDTGTLHYLLGLCADDADGTSRIARLLDQDHDPDTAAMFRGFAAERQQFLDRLIELLDQPDGEAVRIRRAFRIRLFRLRLRIAELVPVGYGADDDRRSVLRLAKRGSDLMRNAYADVQARPLSYAAHREISRQAQAIEAANCSVHMAAAKAERR